MKAVEEHSVAEPQSLSHALTCRKMHPYNIRFMHRQTSPSMFGNGRNRASGQAAVLRFSGRIAHRWLASRDGVRLLAEKDVLAAEMQSLETPRAFGGEQFLMAT